MKKIVAYTILSFTLILFTACSSQTTEEVQTTSEEATGETFTIGILPAESAIPIILAKENGLFEEEGVNVEIKSFSAPTDRNVAVQANELDATIADVMTEATFVENKIAMMITSDITENFKILSSPDSGITSMEDLDGKNISLVPNFILEYIMDSFAENENFTYNIVEIPSFSGRAEALLSNQIDGVVFTEPQASMLVSQGAHLLGSSDEADIKGGSILFTNDMIEKQPGDIKGFYQAYNKAIDYMNSSDASEYAEILTNYQFPEAMSQYLSSKEEDFQYANAIEQDQFNAIIQWTKEKGQISEEYSYEDLTDFSFLP